MRRWSVSDEGLLFIWDFGDGPSSSAVSLGLAQGAANSVGFTLAVIDGGLAASGVAPARGVEADQAQVRTSTGISVTVSSPAGAPSLAQLGL